MIQQENTIQQNKDFTAKIEAYNNIETITTQNIIVFCIYTIIILALATRMFRKNEK